jgi:hypothetical protein
MTFEEWAEQHLGPEIMGVTDWDKYRECWEAAQKGKEDEHSRPS